MSTAIVVESLRRLAGQIAGLTDEQEPDTINRAIELISEASRMLAQRKKSKYATAITASARRFESDAVRYLFERVPDIEHGDPDDENGWHGLYLGYQDEHDSQDFQALSPDDKKMLTRNPGAIISDVGGEVTGMFFPIEDDATDAWEEAISGSEPELAGGV